MSELPSDANRTGLPQISSPEGLMRILSIARKKLDHASRLEQVVEQLARNETLLLLARFDTLANTWRDILTPTDLYQHSPLENHGFMWGISPRQDVGYKSGEAEGVKSGGFEAHRTTVIGRIIIPGETRRALNEKQDEKMRQSMLKKAKGAFIVNDELFVPAEDGELSWGVGEAVEIQVPYSPELTVVAQNGRIGIRLTDKPVIDRFSGIGIFASVHLDGRGISAYANRSTARNSGVPEDMLSKLPKIIETLDMAKRALDFVEEATLK